MQFNPLCRLVRAKCTRQSDRSDSNPVCVRFTSKVDKVLNYSRSSIDQCSVVGACNGSR